MRWWTIALVVAVPLSAINAALITAAYRVAPQPADPAPYQRSRNADAQSRVRAAFIASGAMLQIQTQEGSARIGAVALPAVRELRLERWRPDDPTLDYSQPWDGTATTIDLPRSGRWIIRVHGRVGDDRGVLVEQSVEAR
jgi:hypothetical protein